MDEDQLPPFDPEALPPNAEPTEGVNPYAQYATQPPAAASPDDVNPYAQYVTQPPAAATNQNANPYAQFVDPDNPDPTLVGAGARGFIRNLAPAIGGGAAAIPGMEAGAALGAFGGPFAPVTIPAGAIVGGLITGGFGAAATQRAQDAAVKATGADQGGGVFSNAQTQADLEAHPWATKIGGAGTALVPFGGAATVAQRLGGAALNAAIEGGKEYLTTGEVDPFDVALSGAAGAVSGARPREFLQRPYDAMTRPFRPGRPDMGAPNAAADKGTVNAANDITTTAAGVAHENQPPPQNAVQSAANTAGRSERDYGKNGTPQQAPAPGAPSMVVSNDEIHPDLAAVLQEDNDVQPSQASPGVGAAPAAAPADTVNPGGGEPSGRAPGNGGGNGVGYPETVSQPNNGAPQKPPLIPKTMDPVEASQVQRSAIQKIRDRMAASQKGEAFENLHDEPGESTTQQAQQPEQTKPFQLMGRDLQLPPHVADYLAARPDLVKAIESASVNYDNHVPYIAGATKDGTGVHIDNSIPRTAVLPNGKSFRTAEPMQAHEIIERHVMEELIKGGMDDGAAYKTAHWMFAEPLEDAIYRAQGVDPKAAETFWGQRSAKIEKEPTADTPVDLYTKPYPHDNPHDAHEDGVTTHQPSTEELAAAQRILMGTEAPTKPGATTPVPSAAAKYANAAPLTPRQERLVARFRKDLPAGKSPPKVSQKLLETAFKMLKAEGRDDIIQAWIDHPENVAEQARKYVASKFSATGEATGETTRTGLPTKRATAGGVQTGGGERGERKAQAIQAVRDAFASLTGTPLPEGRNNIIARAREVVAQATKSNNGNDPIGPAKQGGYRPTSKHEDFQKYQVFKAAARVAKAPTAANIKELQKVASGALGEGKDARDVEASIAADKTTLPIQEETVGGVRAGETPELLHDYRDRDQFDPMPMEDGKDNTFAKEYNDLAKWVNGLDDQTWHRLDDNVIGGISEQMKEVMNPRDMMEEWKEELNQQAKFEPPSEPRAPEGYELAGHDPNTGSMLLRPKAFNKPGVAGPDGEPTMPPAGTLQKIAAMLKDESGYVTIPQWVDETLNHLMSVGGGRGTAAQREIGQGLSRRFNFMTSALDNMNRRLLLALTNASKLDQQTWATLDRKLRNRTPLTADEQKLYDDNVKPLRDWGDRLDRIWQRLNPKLARTPYVSPFTEYLSRMKLPDEPGRLPNEAWKRGLPDFASSNEERDFFALRDAKSGALHSIFKMNDDGTVTLFKNNKSITKPAGNFTGELGATLSGPRGTQLQVDHANPVDIMTHVPGVKYVENPVVSEINRVRGLQSALFKKRLLDKIASDPDIKANSTTDLAEARRLGYSTDPTQLKELAERNGKTVYYAKPIAWALDDFARPGLMGSSVAAEKIRNFAQNLAKPLYFFSPFFHAFNVGANWWAGQGGLIARAGLSNAPANIKNMVGDMGNAWKDTMQQGDLTREFMAHGGRLMRQGTLIDRGVVDAALSKFGYNVARHPSIFEPFSKATGLDIAGSTHAAMRASNKVMWTFNDALALSLYQQAKRSGLSGADAVDAVHNYIGAYRPNSPTLMHSRVFQQVVNEPAVSWFGPYHQDLLRGMGTVVKKLATGTGADRREAAGAIIAATALMAYVYPHVIDPFVQWLTGNKNASFGRRGFAAPIQAAMDAYSGHDSGITGITHNIITPSLPATALMDAVGNMDWKGGHIISPNYFNSPKALLRGAGQAAGFAARTLIPPYGAIASQASHGHGVGDLLRRFGESTVGIKEPTPGALTYEGHLPQHIREEQNKRQKNPGDFIEQFTNSLTR